MSPRKGDWCGGERRAYRTGPKHTATSSGTQAGTAPALRPMPPCGLGWGVDSWTLPPLPCPPPSTQPCYTVTFVEREKSHLGGTGKGTVGEPRDEGSPHLGLAHTGHEPPSTAPPNVRYSARGEGCHWVGAAGLFALLLLRAAIKTWIPATVSLLWGEGVARKHRPCSPPPTSDKTSFSSLESST